MGGSFHATARSRRRHRKCDFRRSVVGDWDKMFAEIGKVVEESTSRLLQLSPPPIRYFLLTDALGRDKDDPIVQQVVRSVAEYPPRIRLLKSLRQDGTWPISKSRSIEESKGPGPPVGWTFETMLQNLYTLGDYVTRNDEGNVPAALERILGWIGDEGYILGPKTAAFPMPHYNAFALRDLLQFEMDDDPRTKNLTSWLLSMQRDDGGWNIPYMQDLRYLPQYRHMKASAFWELINGDERPPYDSSEYKDTPSCIWTTMMVVRALSWSKELAFGKEARRGADFFLDRFFRKNHHTSFYHSEENWTSLKYPTSQGSGLTALDILTYIGYGPDDERMEKPIRWLLSCRSKDGLWHRARRPHPEKDLWITETAITILRRYVDLR